MEWSRDGSTKKYTSRDDNWQVHIPTSIMNSMTTWKDVAKDVYLFDLVGVVNKGGRGCENFCAWFAHIYSHHPLQSLTAEGFALQCLIAPAYCARYYTNNLEACLMIFDSKTIKGQVVEPIQLLL